MGFASAFSEAFNSSYDQSYAYTEKKKADEMDRQFESAVLARKELQAQQKADAEALSNAQMLATAHGQPVGPILAALKGGASLSVVTAAAENGRWQSRKPQAPDQEPTQTTPEAGLADTPEAGSAASTAAASLQTPSGSQTDTGGEYTYVRNPIKRDFGQESEEARLGLVGALDSGDPERIAAAERRVGNYARANQVFNPSPPRDITTTAGLVAAIALESDPQRKTQLQGALKELTMTEANAGRLAQGPVEGVVSDGNGGLRRTMIEAVSAPDGGVQYIDRNTGEPAEAARPVTEEEQKATAALRVNASSPAVEDQRKRMVSITSGLRSSALLVQMVEKNPDILLPVTGRVAETLDAAKREAAGALKLFGVELGANGQIDASNIDNIEQTLDSIDLGAVSDLAHQRAYFEAQIGVLAYRMGAAEGQSGQAFGEKDYNRIAAAIRGSNSGPEFIKIISSYMNGQVKSINDGARLLGDYNGAVKSFEDDYGYRPVPAYPTLDEFVRDSGDDVELRRGYELATQASPLEPSAEETSTTPQPTQTTSSPGPRAVEALRANPDRAADFDAKFGQGAAARILGN